MSQMCLIVWGDKQIKITLRTLCPRFLDKNKNVQNFQVRFWANVFFLQNFKGAQLTLFCDHIGLICCSTVDVGRKTQSHCPIRNRSV